MKNPQRKEMSRREFTLTATLAAAAVAAVPADMLGQQQKPPTTPAPAKPPEPEGPKLSDAARREVELKVQSIMDKYGAKLNDAQKADVRKLAAQTQEGLESLRAFPIDNWDEPAAVLHFNDSPAKGARP
jgi:hypothetical protein